MTHPGKNRVRSIERACQIMELIAKNSGKAKLTAISEELELANSTVHRIIATLVDMGYLTQDLDNGEYALGPKLLYLGGQALYRHDLRKTAIPFLERLRDGTDETANLAVLDDDKVMYIEKAESRSYIRVFSLIGRRAPVHATGMGKVIAAHIAWTDVLQILRKKGMPRLTPTTIVEVDAFMEELNKVRAQGYALDNEECEEGVICIAAPVFDYTGKAIAALSVSGPKDRMGADRRSSLIPVVKKAARELSLALGWQEVKI